MLQTQHLRVTFYLPLALFAYLFSSSVQFFLLDKLYPLSTLVLLLSISLCFFLTIRFCFLKEFRFQFYIELTAFLVVVFLLALTYVTARATSYLEHRLPEELEQKEVYIQGYVSSLPKRTFSKYGDSNLIRQDFDFTVLTFYPCDSLSNKQACQALASDNAPQKIRLSLYRDSPDFFVKGGDRYQFLVKLKRPRSTLNFSGFDYETWLFANNYHAKGYVRGKGDNNFLGFETTSLTYLREALRVQMLVRFSDEQKFDSEQVILKDAQSLILALVLGDRTYISTKLDSLLANTGTAHLLAISGLHIALVSFGSYFLFNYFFRLSARFFYNYTYDSPPLLLKQSALVLSLLMALIYAFLSGFSLPAQRAFIMVCCYALGIFFLRKTNFFYVFISSLLLVLIWDPFAILQSGVFLSFGAVFLIHWSMLDKKNSIRTNDSGLLNSIKTIFGTQFAVYLGLMPLLLTFFSRFFFLSLICNLIAIPLVSFVVLPLCLFFSLTLLLASLADFYFFEWLSQILLNLSEYALDALLFFLALFEAYFTWSISIYFTALTSLLLFIAILFWMSPLPGLIRHSVWVFVVSICVLMSPYSNDESEIPSSSFALRVLDVGQGLSVIVETSNHRLIYDTGPGHGEDFNAGLLQVIPRLLSTNAYPWQGLRLNKMILSHGDNDHIGGAISILKEVQVDEVLAYPQGLYENNADFNTFHTWQLCEAGQSWTWDGVQFTVLWPLKSVDLSLEKSNNRSCVIRVKDSAASLLLTGDIESKVEAAIIKNYREEDLKSELLIAPHHGSKTSSSKAFLGVVAPKVIIFSTGYRNRFKHPHEDVLTRVGKSSMYSFNTANDGEIDFESWRFLESEPLVGFRLAREERNAFWRFRSK